MGLSSAGSCLSLAIQFEPPGLICKLFFAQLIVVRIHRSSRLRQEETRILDSRYDVIFARLSEREELVQIACCPLVSKTESALLNTIDPLDHAQNAAEVVGCIFNQALGGVGRNHQQRHSETILIVSLASRRLTRQC